MAIQTITLLETSHPHAQIGHFLSQFHPSAQQYQTKARSPLALFHYEVTLKQSLLRQIDSIFLLMAQLSNLLHQELHV